MLKTEFLKNPDTEITVKIKTIKITYNVCVLSHIRLFATPWTITCQAPLSMEFSRQEHWSGLPFPFPGNLPDLGIKPRFPALQVDSLPSEPRGK